GRRQEALAAPPPPPAPPAGGGASPRRGGKRRPVEFTSPPPPPPRKGGNQAQKILNRGPRFRGDERRGVARRKHHGRELTQQPHRRRYNPSQPVHATFSGRAIWPSRREGTMRVMAATVTAASVLAAAAMPAATATRADDAEIEQIVRKHVQPMLIAAGGMAVAVHIDDRTLFFNYGLADVARKEPITSDSLFNLASVGKVFLSTLLAQAV